MEEYRVSVVVPVLNQYDSLKKVLYGFSQQEYDKSQFEIIVIDDGSSDDLKNFSVSDEKGKR